MYRSTKQQVHCPYQAKYESIADMNGNNGNAKQQNHHH